MTTAARLIGTIPEGLRKLTALTELYLHASELSSGETENTSILEDTSHPRNGRTRSKSGSFEKHVKWSSPRTCKVVAEKQNLLQLVGGS